MIVVVAIVLVILSLAVPAASTLWNERKTAGAVNTIRGLLMTSRARAVQADGVESGFLAYLDGEGVQHLVPIEQPRDRLADLAWQNVFTIGEGRDHVLPAPMRVVPRYVVEDPTTGGSFERFSNPELANNNFATPPGDQAQRHRNFFTMIYSPDGQLLLGRDVLIQDDDAEPDLLGDRTLLHVGPGPPPPGTATTTSKFYTRDNAQSDIDSTNAATTFPHLVVDSGDIALNFPSVDGLLVYDDSLFRDMPASQKRAILLRTARPLYVSRWTGVVIRGPVGENVTP
jgi:hypothetical protein